MVTRYAASTTHGQLPAAQGSSTTVSLARTPPNKLDILTPRLSGWSGDGVLQQRDRCFPYIHLLPRSLTLTKRATPCSDAFEKAAKFLPDAAPADAPVPSHLRCSLCDSLYRDAVLILCCQKSFCDACVRAALQGGGSCPSCGDGAVNADQLYPNRDLRSTVEAFKLNGLDAPYEEFKLAGAPPTARQKRLLE
jgi:hypothetical protein